MKYYDLTVIGAGPAGLMAALSAADAGASVCLLEKNKQPGRKLLLAGSGRCNLTHTGTAEDFLPNYAGRDRFVKPALYAFSPESLKEFFKERGLPLTEMNEGKFFPVSEKSSDVLKILVLEAEGLGVKIINDATVESILPLWRGGAGGDDSSAGSRVGDGFEIRTEKGLVIHSKSIVISVGGRSYPSTGSSGDGYLFARSLGHSVIDPRPALTSLEIPESPFFDLSGISLNSGMGIYKEGKLSRRDDGDLLFTHKGFSGPLILNNSRYISPGDRIELNFSGTDSENLKAALVLPETAAGGKLVKTAIGNLLAPLVPGRLITRLMELAGIPQDKKLAEAGKKPLVKLIVLLTACPLTAGRLGGWGEAMVTAGGVDTAELNPRTMESRIVPGLFFAGEVLDVDGDEGGFNLQYAFSSGWLAGKSAAAAIKANN